MSETAIQFDMTQFYSADRALRALRVGHIPAAGPPELRAGMGYLATIIVFGVIFDKIVVGVPAIIDTKVERNKFAPDASDLSEDLLKASIVSVLSLPREKKTEVVEDLNSLAKDYRDSTIDFLAGLNKYSVEALGHWASGQLDSNKIMRHTREEEAASQFHRLWTVDFVNVVISDLKERSSAPLISTWPDEILRHVVNNCARGFIYQAANAQTKTIYLPFFVREGLIAHAKDNRPRAKAIMGLCSKFISEDDMTGVFSQSRGKTLEIPLLRAAILQKFEEKGDYRHEAVTDLICEERKKPANVELRTRLRKTGEKRRTEQMAESWFDMLIRDREVWEGDRLPSILNLVPSAVQLVPGLNADKAEKLLQAIVPGLRSKSELWRTLRRPIYLRKHMRYLWGLFR